MEDAYEITQQLRRGEYSKKELILQTAKQVEKLNPNLNAVVHTRFEKALVEADNLKDVGQPFYGVPLFLKALGQSLEGEPQAEGSRLFIGKRAKKTSKFVERLQSLGFIIVGATNTPEFGLKNRTDSLLYGDAKNPLALNCTPGGSSGGAASIVASGIAPLAAASDGGGSIRIPASFTGLIGMKPSRGRMPVGPGSFRGWEGLAGDFALTKTLRDTLHLLSTGQSLQIEAPYLLPTNQATDIDYDFLLSQIKNKPIAYSTESPVGTPVSTQAVQSVKAAVHFLESLGFHCVEQKNPLNGLELMNGYYTICATHTAHMFMNYEKNSADLNRVKQSIEPISWGLYQWGKNISAIEYINVLNKFDQATVAMHHFHKKYPIYLTPTTATIAPKLNTPFETAQQLEQMKHLEEYDASEQARLIWQVFAKSLAISPFTQQANITGAPAISLPFTNAAQKELPIGIQFQAEKGNDFLLLAVASLFEQANQLIK